MSIIYYDNMNTELQDLYDKLKPATKEKLDKLKLRDKIITLKAVQRKQNNKINAPVLEVADEGAPVVEVAEGSRDTKVRRPFKMPQNGDVSGYFGPDNLDNTDNPDNLVIPQELFKDKYEDTRADIEEKKTKKLTPAEEFDKLINRYYDSTLFLDNTWNKQNELEVRFGTKGIKPITKNDYDNVVKILKSFDFKSINQTGQNILRIKTEFLDNTGNFKQSDLRVEINGIASIEHYCKNDDIKSLPTSAIFQYKRNYFTPEKEKIFPVNVDDFNFRVSLQTEETASKGTVKYVMDNWRKTKKAFRYINRVRFVHDDYPIFVDLSITKSGNKIKDTRGFMKIDPVYNVKESNVFNNQESYEIEVELDNKKIGPGTLFNSGAKILVALRKVIKYVLSGLQNTMYPVSYSEQNSIMNDYMKMIWNEEYDTHKQRITSRNFIGPSPITLQLTNIAPINTNSTISNIRKDFVVTEKADGDRNLIYVSKIGNIYLINVNMDIKFTGAKTLNNECFNTLMDGEFILHDKTGELINLFLAFDIYFYKNRDIRDLPLMLSEKDKNIYNSRYQILLKVRELLKPVSILYTPVETIINKVKSHDISSPIKFDVKHFYPNSYKQTIFEGCKQILEKEKENLFEYETDGLIFTHAFYGVGSNEIGKAGPKTKVTWNNAFKWKPPQYNTIDFLVTTLKSVNGEDIVKYIFEDGINSNKSTQQNEYKTIELRCGFNEREDGFMNPCQDIIDDNIPEFKPRFEDKQSNEYYVPKRFYPSEPYDANAGITNIMLKQDGSSAQKMFTKENDLIIDNTIVEFSYNLDAPEGWRWEPLRVRYDKTAKMRRGEKEYGNSYKVCNENWKSIQPSGRITEIMLMTGEGIPELNVSEDIYYNRPAGKLKTNSMKNFHNLYVKKRLITGVSKEGETLIDFACGKAGDLPKWVDAKLSFVFGLDFSQDNLENRIDGACVRYLKTKQTNKRVPAALFAYCNSSLNIMDGTALLNDKAKLIASAVFGKGPKKADIIGKGVEKQYGKGNDGFNVSSCQFAIHYFFESPDILRGFLKNVAECTKLNGYFIGTSYDGNIMFDELKHIKTNDSVQIYDGDTKIWEVIKNYSADTFNDDSSCIGYKINVYQESINRHIAEFLVNYTYFERIMELYGFKIIDRTEANDLGFPEGSGLFKELFENMLDEIKRNKYKANMYGDAYNMSSFEKKISFLNRYFIYKKIREVNIETIKFELGEYDQQLETQENEDSRHAIEVAKNEVAKLKPKIKKLKKKLILVDATEAIDDSVTIKPPEPEQTELVTHKKTNLSNKTKKIKIID